MVLCQWKHPLQGIANSALALNSSQIPQSLAGRSCLENAQGLGPAHPPGSARAMARSTIEQDHAGALCSQELPRPPLINYELFKFTPSFNCHPPIAFFFFSRYVNFHAWLFCFYSAFGLTSPCLLLIFLCLISHLQDIFFRGHFFLLFYIQAFSFVGLIFVLWVSTWFTISLILPPFFYCYCLFHQTGLGLCAADLSL